MENQFESLSAKLVRVQSFKSNLQKSEEPQAKSPQAKYTKTQKIVLGICAMRKKVQSKPMKQILKRLACPQITFLEMWNCLDRPYKTWPIVDALICFYSEGFPYLKAWKYVKRYKPFLINNLQKQQYLWDRTVVYDILKKIRIPMARHYMVFRNQNYIDEIQAKSFYSQAQLENMNLNRQQSQMSESMQKIQLSDSVELKIAKIESEEYNNGNNGNNGDRQKQLRRSVNRKQTYDEGSMNNPLDKAQKLEKNQQTKEAFTVKKPLGTIGTEGKPCTLRKFHQQRLSKIQSYELQQKDDDLLLKTQQKVHKLKKPFVEKPFDAQNHQICIYYPQSMGGGRKMLFRKVKNSSSTYEPNQNRIRRDGNYIYQQYLPNNAFDIKVYTIGQYYMYAEARKSPTLDGVVERDECGKEKRFPIILTPQEKFIAKKIVHEFGQEVCGFDLLRAYGKSYVCDVNGWSFVKGNPKYWTDCAKILQKLIFNKFFPHLIQQQSKYYERFNMTAENLYRPPSSYNILKQQLRSIVSVFRHGDRSPKLKLKFKTSEPKFIEFFVNDKNNQIKLKDANSLIKLLEVTLQVIGENPNMKSGDLSKLGLMKTVLQSGGHFEGLNRKCQLKVIERDENQKIKKIMIVFKWGGQLSSKGFNDAVQLGKKMRMQKYNDDQDFLSLHSSYRHDLKTYSSDEGRCIKTAASFLKGFLNIQGGLAPIITSMVMTNKKAQNLLDCTSQQNHSKLSQKINNELSEMLNSGEDLVSMYQKIVDCNQICSEMFRIMKQIGNPRQKLKTLHKWIVDLTLLLQNQKLAEYESDIEPTGRVSGNSGQEEYSQNNLHRQKEQDIVLIYQRWSKLQKDFYTEDEMKFNISKIPEIYDTIRHDLSKNSSIFSNIKFDSTSFIQLAKLFAYFVVSNEYGITNDQKIKTAQQIVSPLLDKILVDLMFWKSKDYEQQYWKYQNNGTTGNDWKHIRTRLYFTSASHIYSLLHLLILGNDSQLTKASTTEQAEKINKFVYMSYLSHIQFRLYENLQMEPQNPNRFRVQISIYPDFSKESSIEQGNLGKNGFTIDQIKKFITTVVKQSQQKIQSNYIDEVQKKLNQKATLNVNKRISKQKSHSNHKITKKKDQDDTQ